MWVAAALAFVVLVSVVQQLEDPLDDPDQAEQRVGFVDEGSLPRPAPMVTDGRPTDVLFLRPAGAAAPLAFCSTVGVPSLSR